MFFKKKNEIIVDNYGKECHPVNKRAEDDGWTYAATCSLCGGHITLFPHCEKKCSTCCATIVH